MAVAAVVFGSSFKNRWLDRRKRPGASFLRNRAMMIELRHHSRASVKADTINLQILHYALDVVARFGKRACQLAYVPGSDKALLSDGQFSAVTIWSGAR